MDAYFQENNLLANDILKRNYFIDWKSDNPNKILDIMFSDSGCGKCHKCYLGNLKDTNSIQINLDNFGTLIDWYIKNEFRCDIKLSGNSDWVLNKNEYFDKIIDILYSKFSISKNVPNNIFVSVPKEKFVSNEEICNLISAYTKLLSIGIELNYEIDANGQIIDTYDDEYYSRLFNFVLTNRKALLFGTITNNNLYSWEAQVLWWIKQPREITSRLVINEEVSTKGWEEKEFECYSKILSTLVIYYVGIPKTIEDKLNAINKIFIVGGEKGMPFQMHINGFTRGKDLLNCDAHNALNIRCSDLSVFICHNLSDKILKIGAFEVTEDKEDLNFVCNTVELFIVKEYCKISSIPYCEQCPFVGICDSICLAQSYYTYNTPLVPVMNTCDFFERKLNYLITLYNKLGIFDAIDNSDIDKSEVRYIKDLVTLVVKNNEE